MSSIDDQKTSVLRKVCTKLKMNPNKKMQLRIANEYVMGMGRDGVRGEPGEERRGRRVRGGGGGVGAWRGDRAAWARARAPVASRLRRADASTLARAAQPTPSPRRAARAREQLLQLSVYISMAIMSKGLKDILTTTTFCYISHP
jgi:hypothetical protein